MLNPNDAAYILQKIYPIFIAYRGLSEKKQVSAGGFSRYLENELRVGFGQQLLHKGGVLYALFGAARAAGGLVGRKRDGAATLRSLVSEAIASYERAQVWLRQKGRISELQALNRIIASDHESKEFNRLWPRCATELQIYSRHGPTLEKALRVKIDYLEQRLAHPNILQRPEDLKDFKSLLELLRDYVEKQHHSSNLYRAYRRLEMMILSQGLGNQSTLLVATGDLLEGLCSVLVALFRQHFRIPVSEDKSWGLSESSFLALCVEARRSRQLREIHILGSRLRHKLPDLAIAALSDVVASNQHLATLDLSDNGISGHSLKPLGLALPKAEHLSRLLLSGNFIGEMGADHLAVGLRDPHELTEIDLSNCAIGNGGINTIGEALAGAKFLRIVRLSNNAFDDIGCIGVAVIIRESKIRELDLDYCSIGDEGARILAEAIAKNKGLTKLSLRHCDLSNTGATALQKASAERKPRLSIDMEGNRVEESSEDTEEQIKELRQQLRSLVGASEIWKESERIIKAVLLAAQRAPDHASKIRLILLDTLAHGVGHLQMLKETMGDSANLDPSELTRALYQVYLSFHPEQQIRDAMGKGQTTLSPSDLTRAIAGALDRKQLLMGDEGAIALSQLIANNQVQTLDLVDQAIGARGADALGRGLTSSGRLIKLSLENNPLGDTGISALGLSLLTNTSLRTLRLVEAGLGVRGAESLGDSIAANRTLRKLSISQKDLDTATLVALLANLARNRGLQKLIIQKALFSKEAAEAVAMLLVKHPTIQTLELGWMDLDQEMIEILAEAIKENATLVELRLPYCGIEDDAAELLDQVLRKHPKFQRLDLSGNELSLDVKALIVRRSDMAYFKKF